MQNSSKFARIRKKLTPFFLAILIGVQTLLSAIAAPAAAIFGLGTAIGLGTVATVAAPVALTVGVAYFFYTLQGSGSKTFATPYAASKAAPTNHTAQAAEAARNIHQWFAGGMNPATSPLSPTEKSILDKVLDANAGKKVDIHSAFQTQIKKEVNERIKNLKSATTRNCFRDQLEFLQTLIETLDLAAAQPDKAIFTVFHHLVGADGNFIPNKSKCLDSILYFALQYCPLKPGFSLDGLFLNSGLSYSKDCVDNKNTNLGGQKIFAPCEPCIQKLAEAMLVPREQIEPLVTDLRKIIYAHTAQDPRQLELSSNDLFLANPFCTHIFDMFLRMGYCGKDPLLKQKDPDLSQVLKRGQQRKEIDVQLGLTSSQSADLATLNYRLISKAGDPKAQADILLAYVSGSKAKPVDGIAPREIYFNKDGRCKLVELAAMENFLLEVYQGRSNKLNALAYSFAKDALVNEELCQPLMTAARQLSKFASSDSVQDFPETAAAIGSIQEFSLPASANDQQKSIYEDTVAIINDIVNLCCINPGTDLPPIGGSSPIGETADPKGTCGSSKLDQHLANLIKNLACGHDLNKTGNIDSALDIVRTCGKGLGAIEETPKWRCNWSKERGSRIAPPKITCNDAQQIGERLKTSDLTLAAIARETLELKPGIGRLSEKSFNIPDRRYTIPEAEKIIEDAKNVFGNKGIPGFEELIRNAEAQLKKAKEDIAKGNSGTNLGHITELETALFLNTKGINIAAINLKIKEGGKLIAEFDMIIEIEGKLFAVECKSFDWTVHSEEGLRKVVTQIERHIKAIKDYKGLLDSTLKLAGRTLGYLVITPNAFPSAERIATLPTKEQLWAIISHAKENCYEILGLSNWGEK